MTDLHIIVFFIAPSKQVTKQWKILWLSVTFRLPKLINSRSLYLKHDSGHGY